MYMLAKTVGVSVEHVRGWGRNVCEGIAAFAREHPEWNLVMYEDGLPSKAELNACHGFLWCVSDAKTAAELTASRRPVIDLISDGKFPGTVSVGADHEACGRMAAEHFLSRHFTHFAFLGWQGLNFSGARESSFAAALASHSYACAVYSTGSMSMSRFVNESVQRERLVLPPDEKEIVAWLGRLPKPVGVFCANDLRAWQLSAICRQYGIAVPDEVAILGADNDSVPCFFSSAPLSSVDTNTRETGYRAAVLLDDLMTGRRTAAEGGLLVPPCEVVARESTAVDPVEPPWLASALAFIRANVDRPLSAEEVVRQTGKSYATVENAFRRELGTSVQKEIMRIRLERAEHYLRTTSMPLAQIAARCGFATQQYFNLRFRRVHGVTPGEWRQRS